MDRYAGYDKDNISEYIEKQLLRDDISDIKKEEINIINDVFINGKCKKEIYKKYDVCRTTLWRIENRFFAAYDTDKIYVDVKIHRNKLTDAQRVKLHTLLKHIPLHSGIPYLTWDKSLLKDYIHMEFGVEYSLRHCDNIIKKNISYIDNIPLKEYINNNFIEHYFLEVLFLGFKNNSRDIEIKKQKSKKCYIGKYIKKNIYTALVCSNIAFGISKSFEEKTTHKEIVYKLLDILVEELSVKKNILIVIVDNKLKLIECLELNNKYENINFLFIKKIDYIEGILKNDLKEIKENLLNQSKGIEFSFKSRYKETINTLIQKS